MIMMDLSGFNINLIFGADTCPIGVPIFFLSNPKSTLIVLIPLDEVRKGWSLKQYPHQVKTMASYLGIFDHMFDGKSFTPLVAMNVDYQDGSSVHYGNFLSPEKVMVIGYHHQKSKIFVLDNNMLYDGCELFVVILPAHYSYLNQTVLPSIATKTKPRFMIVCNGV